jgi:two-component system cell cycle sensor histidine kinase/response regulator CckA
MDDSSIHMLLVEDSPTDVLLLQEALADVTAMRIAVTSCTRLSEALDRLSEQRFAAVLLDLGLPDSQGLATLVSVQRQDPRTPIVVLTGLDDEAVALRALQEGAQDYLLKGQITGSVLARAIRYAIERKRGAEALREREHMYRALLEQAADGIFIADPDGNYLMVNPRSCEMLGYSQAELLQRNLTDIIPAEELARAPLRLDELREGKTLITERRLRCKDGTLLPVEISAKMLADGRLQGIVRDSTERKRLEAQLLHTQKMESIGQLAGGIAHDFNNMLSAIIGFLDSAQEQLPTDTPAHDDLAAAAGAAWRAAGLTRQLLAFARKQIVDPRVLNLNSVILDLGSMLRRLLGEDIELRTVLASDLGQVKVDPGQMEQVLVNLSVNARDAMPQGGILTIETANTLLDSDYVRQHVGVTAGAYVMLAMSDTGCGMDVAVQQHIFEPFFTTKEHGKGTGLGLATCYGIVKQHGGNIWVYSEVGHGTTFKIYLPRVEEPPDAVLRDTTHAAPEGSETVLLVEDEPVVRGLASRMLREQGYTVLEATNGEEAVHVAQACAGATIALLVTDVVMPRMSGKALAEQLISWYPQIKVLFISGYATDAITHHGQLDAGTNFLSKPFARTTFACKVREVLDS